ncbi:hypothetical protein AVEN_72760-1 [Araneus ventricosus]|uniref:Histone-lysine N-methyltransferase SETMAR n=1 Tax=Araneus ventricosus TaxID=182803 RepID=A0A4Y2DQC3_ARAVE|nr:hypothetical protein AVEN_72760-1 [Araneus ventricosus]
MAPKVSRSYSLRFLSLGDTEDTMYVLPLPATSSELQNLLSIAFMSTDNVILNVSGENRTTVEFIKLVVHCIHTKDRSLISAAQLTPLFDHPPYSPDLAPSDFHLFLKLKEFLGGKPFGSDEELENEVTI